MFKKIKNIILQIDRFFYKKFRSGKSTKTLQNISEAHIIFSILNEIGKDTKVRFVGGCVRKAICGENITDIDLATSLEPSEVKRKLKKEDIEVIDTGISHGTVTALLNKKIFEITTLREDLSTDGRHANVKFTTSWDKDALRRDFTINAIYADIEGRIFDPLNGMEDLKNGKVKFIGSIEKRIQEDYLRILRYFRFFTEYSKTDHDQDSIRFIKQNINGLNNISNERIFSELKKILTIHNINSLLSNSISNKILQNIFPQLKYYERLKIINNLNKKIKKKYDKILILALLIVDESNSYEYFCHKYKASNNIKNRLENISKNYLSLKNNNFALNENIEKGIYLSNKDYVLDLLLFSICVNKKIRNLDLNKLTNYINTYKVPIFPITGEYLKKHGYKTGKILGEKLKFLEKMWVENNFIIDKKEVLKSLKKKKKI